MSAPCPPGSSASTGPGMRNPLTTSASWARSSRTRCTASAPRSSCGSSSTRSDPQGPAPGGERLPAPGDPGRRLHRRCGPEPGARPRPGARLAGGAHVEHRPDPRRDRDRQGAGGAGDPRAQPAARPGPFVKVNCAALPATLIESELFGHERGAFTGAIAAHAGPLRAGRRRHALPRRDRRPRAGAAGEAAARAAGRRGSSAWAPRGTRKVDVRVVAATNRDLERAMAEGRFRRDLYYRLSVFPIAIPPLRERAGGHPACSPGPSSSGVSKRPGPAHRADPAGADGRARRLRLARQRARARERDRARAHPLAGQGAAAGRPAARAGPKGGALRRGGLPGRAGRTEASTRWLASTCAPCSSAASGGSTGREGQRRSWRSTPTPCAHA